MIAPVAFEDLNLPQQSLPYWGGFEMQQWKTAMLQLNTSDFAYQTSASRIGSSYGIATYKWWGASLAPNGKIYASPHSRSDVLVINTADDSVATTGSINGTNQGNVYDAVTNTVYSFGSTGFKINCATDVASNISGPGNRTQNGVQYITANEIYTVGLSPAGVYKYTISSNTTSARLFTTGSGEPMSVVQTDYDSRMIYGLQTGGSFVYYDPIPNTGGVFSTGLANYTYSNPIFYPDGFVYNLPNGGTSQSIKRINPKTLEVVNVTTATNVTRSGACIGGDGRIYTCATNSGVVSWYDPRTNSQGTITLGTGDSGFQNICMGPDGSLYLIPYNSAYVNVIKPAKGGQYVRSIFANGAYSGRLKPSSF